MDNHSSANTTSDPYLEKSAVKSPFAMADWLRPVFRSRTPNPSSGSFASPDPNDSDVAPLPRAKSGSRVSSFIGLQHLSPSVPVSPSFSSFKDVRDPETVYHKPSSYQMAEMVKVVMMNQSSFDPIPIQYNGAILNVLEDYYDLCMEMGERDKAIAELKESHLKDIKDFETLTKEWEDKEKNYKAEMKKLEVLLSRTEGGLEKVTIARTKSTVHGYVKTSETIGKRVATIKERHSSQDKRRDDASSELDSFDRDISEGEQILNPFMNPRKPRRSHINQTSSTDQATQTLLNIRFVSTNSSEESFHKYFPHLQMSPKRQAPTHVPFNLTGSQLEALEHQRADQVIDESFGSSHSESSSMFQPYNQRKHVSDSASYAKALPTIMRHSLQEGETFDLQSSKPKRFSQMGFSFRQGDDTDLASLAETGDVIYKPHPRSISVGQAQPAVTAAKSAARTSISPLHVHVYREIIDKDKDSLARHDSTSSVITAFRHNSGKSSATGSARNSIVVDQPKGAKPTGSNEAVAAAMRAFAGSSASKIPRKSPSGSRSNNRRGSNNQLEPPRKESSAKRTASRDSRHSRTGSGEVRHITTLQNKRDSLGVIATARSSAVSVEIIERRSSIDSSESSQ